MMTGMSQNTLLNPLRTKMWLPENVGVLGIMPAFIKGIDNYEAALNETGDILISMQEGIFTEKHIIGDITDVLTQKCPRRTNDAEITLFKSVGIAIEDVAAAFYIYQKRNRYAS